MELKPGVEVRGAGVGLSVITMQGRGPLYKGPDPTAAPVFCPRQKHVLVIGGAERQMHQITIACDCGASRDFP
jgi:hypothetical protein